jgi:hypothetical protein
MYITRRGAEGGEKGRSSTSCMSVSATVDVDC